MATYKLIQDIEAEDHILGPLTLRQFIFSIVACFFLYLSFIVLTKGAPFLLAIFLPPALFCAFFAFPFGHDQPTEIWFLAKLRYWFLPRKRIWDQTGVKELVTITVPKRIEPVLTDGLSQTEVKSRLQALANTIDSRGWAIKNVDATFTQRQGLTGDSERLISLDSIPQDVAIDDTTAADDMLDISNNQVAQQVSNMVDQSAQTHRSKLMQELQTGATQQPANWFMDNGAVNSRVSGPSPVQSVSDAQLSAQLKQRASTQDATYANMRSVQANNDPTVLALAGNDDLNVATIAREVHKAKGEDDPNEVIISLH